ncbi:DNA topoisomerase I [Marinomonas sp. M1K-6]|uniref:DNA topoisomerase I n=1 Tax=Marinomonas profundi TaxID=2726122 RepID=A0A847R2X8_9GAMM|nr:DNA topoisomerase I [Marinomonas profundi]NLQ16256.1 DNA topoisomerase I [Marinomonas profundi]UDV03167.1 DNA topoisomerase I [Marinomonas profundi]
MATLQILTIAFLIIIVLLSVVIGSRAHQKEKEMTERRVKQLQLSNRADRVEQHIRGLKDINTDPIATDVLYDFYLDTLRELLQYTDDPEKIEIRIATAEEARDSDPIVFNPEPEALSFQEKSNYKERLTKLAKMLLYLRRKGRISHSHYQACYDYLRWLNLWVQLNRQMVQANKNFSSGDMRVAQTLYGVILSHLKSDSIERPEKNTLNTFVTGRIKDILSPKIAAMKNSENPEEALSELLHDIESSKQTEP